VPLNRTSCRPKTVLVGETLESRDSSELAELGTTPAEMAAEVGIVKRRSGDMNAMGEDTMVGVGIFVIVDEW